MLECTNWNVFKDSCNSIDELCETIAGYISFCEDLHSSKKEIISYPNNKPWVSKELKEILNEKKAFKLKDRDKLKTTNNMLKKKIRECKHVYKEKLEQHFTINNTKMTWQCLKTIVGDAPFDNHDFSDQLTTVKETIQNDRTDDSNNNNTDEDNDKSKEIFVVNVKEVKIMFNRLKAHKARGPDGVKSKIIKMCSTQLSPICTDIFNMSLKERIIPLSWKCSEIIPIPRKQSIQNLNDLRPVALTSVLMKCLEKLVLKELRK